VVLITDGCFDATLYRAKNQEHYDMLLKQYEVPPTPRSSPSHSPALILGAVLR
jgi:hypothetical protein